MSLDQGLAQSIPGATDSIAAVATPPGRGAISVVRLSGPGAFDIAGRIVDPWPLTPRRATLCRIRHSPEGSVLDQALVTSFVAPDSFTGEHLVEISGHGGQLVPALLMEALVAGGARPALPGEFSRRAVLNGKLDLTQAEAIGDLIDARSEAMHKAALKQLDGGLSRRIDALRRQLINVEALIAYDIDFPEEDDGPISRERVTAEVEALLSALDTLLATVPAGEIIREGAVVVIAGRPNVGKSSLFNAMLGSARAIVTDIPGTTRDAIEGAMGTEHWPLRLVDTAGLRETSDTVERIGIEVSERYLSQANVVLACGDDSNSLAATLAALEGKVSVPLIKVRTKSDINTDTSDMNINSPPSAEIRVSAETGDGLTRLTEAIDAVLSQTVGHTVVDAPILLRSRHIREIAYAREEIDAFRKAWKEESLPGPVAAVHLREANVALESLIGAISTEDVLDLVFSSFCVGK